MKRSNRQAAQPKTPKFREGDGVRLNANYTAEPRLIGAVGTVTRGSYGRKNPSIFVELEDKAAADKYTKGDPVLFCRPEEIDHHPAVKK